MGRQGGERTGSGAAPALAPGTAQHRAGVISDNESEIRAGLGETLISDDGR